MLRTRLDAAGVAGDIRSAGLMVAPGGGSDGLARTTREWGIDLSDHESRPLSPGEVRGADLVLTMEHHQVAEIVTLDPDSWPRTFTIKEIVRRAEEKGPRSRDETFSGWVERLHSGRTRLGLVGAWHDDVADPAGLPPSELDRTIAELDMLVARLSSAAWPSRRGRR